MVWKRKRSGSTKPEQSTVDEGKLQTSQPNKPEPIYTERSDGQNNIKNSSNNSVIQQSVAMQNQNHDLNEQAEDNPAYHYYKVPENDPAYFGVVDLQVNNLPI